MWPESVEGQYATVGVALQCPPMEIVEVVILPESVECDLPVGAYGMNVRIAVRLPVVEVQHGQLVRETWPQVGVDVDRAPGPQAADDEAVSLGNRQFHQPLVVAAQAFEGARHRDSDKSTPTW